MSIEKKPIALKPPRPEMRLDTRSFVIPSLTPEQPFSEWYEENIQPRKKQPTGPTILPPLNEGSSDTLTAYLRGLPTHFQGDAEAFLAPNTPENTRRAFESGLGYQPYTTPEQQVATRGLGERIRNLFSRWSKKSK